jgi:hypothetical protein
VALLPSPWTPAARHYDQIHSVLPNNDGAQVARWMGTHAPEGSSLAIRDAGVLPFWVGPNVDVHELHQRALTLPHPGGADADVLQYTPQNPTFVVLTQAREDASDVRYGGDQRVFQRLSEPYRYLGRVHQHFHRYYDVYVRTDAAVPALPEALVTNRAGPRGPGAAP